MDEYFDIRTLSFVSGIVGLVLCILMVHVWFGRKTYAGFGLWTAASVVSGVGLVLLSLRDHLPSFVTILIANGLLVVGASLIAMGLEVFTGARPRIWLSVSLTVLLLASFWYLAYPRPSVTYRIVIISAILAVLYGYSGYLVRKRVPGSVRGTRFFLRVVLGLLVAWFLSRAALTGFGEGHIVDFMQASAYQGSAVLIFLVGMVAVFVGLLLLNSQRLESDLRKAVTEVKTLEGLLPICASCKKIRDDDGAWRPLETYIHDHSAAEFSHGICPECAARFVETADGAGGAGP